jgi:hypothetical protein
MRISGHVQPGISQAVQENHIILAGWRDLKKLL